MPKQPADVIIKTGKKKFLAIEVKDNQPVPNYVKAWRIHRGLTQEELAKNSAYTGSAISQLENGHSKYTQTFLEAIAKALNCHPADLLVNNPEQESTEQKIERLCKLVPPERRELLLAVIRAFVESGT